MTAGDTRRLTVRTRRDLGADVLYFDGQNGTPPILALREDQSFDNAVEKVLRALDWLTPDEARDIVRQALPHAPELDKLTGADTREAPRASVSLPARPAGAAPQQRIPRWAKAAAAASVPALALGLGIGHLTAERPGQAPPVAAPDTAAEDAPYDDPLFERFTRDGQMSCQTVRPLQAKCTDIDGMVMYSEAAIGPASTAFTFSYGSEKVVLRVFREPREASAFTREPGARDSYRNLMRHGRYVLWGSDKDRLRQYKELLEEADENRHGAMSAPMPRRLAALALGTLGVTPQTFAAPMRAPTAAAPGSPSPAALMVAVDLVMGSTTETRTAIPDPVFDDAVAAATGPMEPPASTPPDGSGPASSPASHTPAPSPEPEPEPAPPTPEPAPTPPPAPEPEPSAEPTPTPEPDSSTSPKPSPAEEKNTAQSDTPEPSGSPEDGASPEEPQPADAPGPPADNNTPPPAEEARPGNSPEEPPAAPPADPPAEPGPPDDALGLGALPRAWGNAA